MPRRKSARRRLALDGLCVGRGRSARIGAQRDEITAEIKRTSTTCVDTAQHDCVLDGSCRVKPHWAVVNNAVRGALAGITLTQLAATTPLVPSEGRAMTEMKVDA
jgi:hypothetical protein